MSRYNTLKGLVVGAVLVGGLTLGGLNGVLAQESAEPASVHPAFILAGDCADLDANPVGTLNSVESLSASSEDSEDEDKTKVQGSLAASEVLYSTSEDVDVAFDDMLAEAHSITVSESEENVETTLVCGEIGGIVTDDKLIIALHSMNDSGYTGIAILTKDGDGNADVEVYLAQPVNPENVPDATPAG